MAHGMAHCLPACSITARFILKNWESFCPYVTHELLYPSTTTPSDLTYWTMFLSTFLHPHWPGWRRLAYEPVESVHSLKCPASLLQLGHSVYHFTDTPLSYIPFNIYHFFSCNRDFPEVLASMTSLFSKSTPPRISFPRLERPPSSFLIFFNP